MRMMTSALDAELHALLALSAAKTMKEFWRSTRRVLRSALPAASIWFAPEAECALPGAILREPAVVGCQAQIQHFWDLHPLRSFVYEHPGKSVVRLSDAMTDALFLKSGFYREFIASQRERYSVVLPFWQRGSLRSLIGLNRVQSGGDFSRAELQTLGWLHGHFNGALTAVGELQRELSARRTLELILAPLPLSLVVLDWDLLPLYYNDAARDSAALWLCAGSDAGRFKQRRDFVLPADLQTMCAEAKRAWSQSRARSKRPLVTDSFAISHPSLTSLEASVRLVHLDSSDFAMPLFVLVFDRIQERIEANLPDSGKFSQFARLSLREREVASLVCTGDSNKEVAAKLGKSVLTVKTQLHSIYGKLGMIGRGRLISSLQEK